MSPKQKIVQIGLYACLMMACEPAGPLTQGTGEPMGSQSTALTTSAGILAGSFTCTTRQALNRSSSHAYGYGSIAGCEIDEILTGGACVVQGGGNGTASRMWNRYYECIVSGPPTLETVTATANCCKFVP